MKKSEAIRDLAADIIIWQTNNDKNLLNFDKAQDLAETVIDSLQDKGMQPPEAEIKEEWAHLKGVYSYVKKRIWEKE